MELQTDEEHKTYVSGKQLTTILTWAPWHGPSKQMSEMLPMFAGDFPDVRFAKVNADQAPDLVTKMGVANVPTIVFYKNFQIIGKLEGADPSVLLAKMPEMVAAKVADAPGTDPNAKPETLEERMKRLIDFAPVMIFMKGSKSEPFCKFSKQCVNIMNENRIEYSTFNILMDEEVRQGLKDFSNWKTYPQIYVKGELIGGVDILQEMVEDGSLAETIPADCIMPPEAPPLEERLKKLTTQADVVLFMKGTPANPQCGFSNTIVALLKEAGIEYAHFNIFEDEEVRQGLKDYANWKTYPQLWAHGQLLGGLDIVKELIEEGALRDEINSVKP